MLRALLLSALASLLSCRAYTSTLRQRHATRAAATASTEAVNSKPPDFATVLRSNNVQLNRVSTGILQLNIGLYCNQACSHCHVDSSPFRYI